MAFKKTYVVLATEPLPMNKYTPASRKRSAPTEGDKANQESDEPTMKAKKEGHTAN